MQKLKRIVILGFIIFVIFAIINIGIITVKMYTLKDAVQSQTITKVDLTKETDFWSWGQ